MIDAIARHEDYRGWKSWDRDGFAKQTPESRQYYDRELLTAGVNTGTPLSVLEIGFGNGGFAAFCLDGGHSYSGTEIDRELVRRAVEFGIDVNLAPSDLLDTYEGRRFDLICCFDVLEHLTHAEIAAMLSSFRLLLSEDGRVIARFPSGDSPFSLAMWNGDITHRSHIGRGAVQQFCLASGLEAVQIRHPVLPILGLGLRRAVRRSLVTSARWAVRGFVRKVFYDGVPRVVDPNMVIVLRRA